MRIPELLPLVEKAIQIPSMAQSACEKIMTMTHPKAWGDRDANFGASYLDWFKYLDELKSVANDCGHAIFERYPRDQNSH
jgi:hypothetical protein